MSFMHLLQILILAIIQGAAELLPVSSSAHVTVAARLLGYKMGAAEGALMLVMLHTGTMFAVLVYFWPRWKPLLKFLPQLLGATICTGVVGLALKLGIERVFLHGAKIETIFQNLPLIAACLAVVGLVIIAAGRKERSAPGRIENLSWPHAAVIGIVQGIVVPFRGLSRSGCTISAGMFLGLQRMREEFSFALAVLLTPVVIVHELRQQGPESTPAASSTAATTTAPTSAAALLTAAPAADNGTAKPAPLGTIILPSLLGMTMSFLAGLVALHLLSRFMEQGHWAWFGYYCLFAAAATLAIHYAVPVTPT